MKRLSLWKDSFFSALRFLTVVRPGKSDVFYAQSSVYAFAFVGLIIGCGLAGVHLIFGKASPVLMVAYLAFITGFLHLDGLADTFDGLFSHRSREEMLAIMKDSRIGPMGASALVLCLLGKFQAFSSMTGVLPLIAIPALSRFNMVILLSSLPYIRENGLGKDFAGGRSIWKYVQVIFPQILIFIPLGIAGWVFFNIISILFLGFLIVWYRHAVGGITGDMTGAVCELTETAMFITAAWILS